MKFSQFIVRFILSIVLCIAYFIVFCISTYFMTLRDTTMTTIGFMLMVGGIYFTVTLLLKIWGLGSTDQY